MVNSSTMTLIVIVMAIYFIGMIAISWMGRKYGKNFDDFISAGRNCTTLMIIGSAVGSHIGNGYVVGGAASGAAVGLSGAWYGIGCALSYLAVALVLNHRVYKCGYISLPEILNARYGEKMTSVIFSVTTALSYIANIAAWRTLVSPVFGGRARHLLCRSLSSSSAFLPRSLSFWAEAHLALSLRPSQTDLPLQAILIWVPTVSLLS